MRRHFDRDLMNMASPSKVAAATLGVLNGMQNWKKEEQVLATAAVFLHMADFWRVSPQDVFTAATNIMNGKDGRTHPAFLAVRPYIENELAA